MKILKVYFKNKTILKKEIPENNFKNIQQILIDQRKTLLEDKAIVLLPDQNNFIIIKTEEINALELTDEKNEKKITDGYIIERSEDD